MTGGRKLAWDWYAGSIPENVVLDDSAYVETSFSFCLCRSRREEAVRYGRGASSYLGTMFDVGPQGRVELGDYALVHGADAPIDGYGIGTSLTTSSDVPALDCAYKLQEFAGTPRRKKSEGKATWPGRKQVYRTFDAEGRMSGDVLGLADEPGEGEQ